MLEKLEALEKRYDELGRLIGDPAVLANPEQYKQYARAFSDLSEIVEVYREHRKTLKELDEARELVKSGGGGDEGLECGPPLSREEELERLEREQKRDMRQRRVPRRP